MVEERFEEALNRTRSRRERRGDGNERIVSLLQTLAAPPKTLTRMAVRSAGRTSFVNLEDVQWIQGAENYVQLHTATTQHLAHATMQSLIELLDPKVFVRIHRSNIVNVRYISHIESGTHGDFVLTLNNGARVHSSRTYCDVIKKLVSNRP